MSCFGPPVYPDSVLNLPNLGPVSDNVLVQVVEAATSIWDQNRFDPVQGTMWNSDAEAKDALGWALLIGKNGRETYSKRGYSEHVWLNALRNFLRPISDWSKWNPDNKSDSKYNPAWMGILFDPIHWRIYADEGRGPGAGDAGQQMFTQTGQYVDNTGQATQQQFLFNSLAYYYRGRNGPQNYFVWDGGYDRYSNEKWGPSQDAGVYDVNLPPPDIPPLEGFGLTQFLEALTGLDYVQLFAWDYGICMAIALASIFWTDFFPFFKELGLVH